ncbi:MAG: acyltransferase [Verrucomicrobiota bacterium]
MGNIHPTALIEDGVRIGDKTSIWDNVHIRHSTTIGEECIVGEKTHIAYDVHIGNRVKINAAVYICTAVTIEDGVMISAGTIFTNDRFPRATTPDLKTLRSSDPDEETLPTLVKSGATIGAGCTIGCDLSIGHFAMIGMGSVVTRAVPDFVLAYGNPARPIGYVCKCGQLLGNKADLQPGKICCPECPLTYELSEDGHLTAI